MSRRSASSEVEHDKPGPSSLLANHRPAGRNARPVGQLSALWSRWPTLGPASRSWQLSPLLSVRPIVVGQTDERRCIVSRGRVYPSAADRQRAYRRRKRNGPIVTPRVAAGPLVITRATAGPSKWTFTIKPIKALLERSVGDGRGWVDPFAGKHSPAEWTNDLDPSMPTTCHLEADAFCRALDGPFVGVLFDPPYSYRQISEHYRALGRKATALDTSNRFFNRVKNAICDKILPGGVAISCGWNSNGFGKNRGFEMIELLLVAHGQHHNDTIVTVERKLVARHVGAEDDLDAYLFVDGEVT